MIIVNCKVCGGEIKCYESTAHQKVYCSIECKRSITHLDVICLNCGKKFQIAKSRYNGKFIKFKCCSDDCYKKYRENIKLKWIEKHTHTCSNCGLTFVGGRYGKTNLKFCSQDCSKEFMKGEKSPFYNNGTSINGAGYRLIKIGEKYIYEHRIVMEEFLNRKLKSYEIVHHKDENKLNNCIENLQLMTKKEHDRLHNLKRKELNDKNTE